MSYTEHIWPSRLIRATVLGAVRGNARSWDMDHFHLLSRNNWLIISPCSSRSGFVLTSKSTDQYTRHTIFHGKQTSLLRSLACTRSVFLIQLTRLWDGCIARLTKLDVCSCPTFISCYTTLGARATRCNNYFNKLPLSLLAVSMTLIILTKHIDTVPRSTERYRPLWECLYWCI